MSRQQDRRYYFFFFFGFARLFFFGDSFFFFATALRTFFTRLRMTLFASFTVFFNPGGSVAEATTTSITEPETRPTNCALSAADIPFHWSTSVWVALAGGGSPSGVAAGGGESMWAAR